MTGEGVCLSVELATEFKFDFESVYEYHLFRWVSNINFVDELTQCPKVDYINNFIRFNSTKFCNLLHGLSIDELIEEFSFNFA